METAIVNCGAQLHGHVLVNNAGSGPLFFMMPIMTLLFRKKRIGLSAVHVLMECVACLLRFVPLLPFESITDCFGPLCRFFTCIVMDHGDLLRECRHMLVAISSQISLLLAGLQRLEGQQRHRRRFLTVTYRRCLRRLWRHRPCQQHQAARTT